MPRTRVIELDGAKFTIAPLTIRQADDFIASQREALQKNDREAMSEIWQEFVATGLNNAGAEYTNDAIHSSLDLITFTRLRDEILEFSGLSAQEKNSA